MATMYDGSRATGANLITGSGLLLALLISHRETTTQVVTLYDNTAASGTIIAAINVAPEATPFFLRLHRNEAWAFTTGLSADYPNCELNVWAVKTS